MLIETIIKIAPSGILILFTATGYIINYDNLGFLDHLLSRGNIHGAVDHLFEHVEPHTVEVLETLPVTTFVAVDFSLAYLMEALLVPRQLRSVPDSTAIDTRLLHDRSDTGGGRIGLAMILAEDTLQSTIPATVVVTHTIVFGETRDERTEGDTLVVVEARRGGVFIKEEHGLGIFLTGLQQFTGAL